MNIRAATDSDAEAVLALLRETPTLPQWGRDALAIPQSPVQASGVRGVTRRVLVAEEKEEVVGFAQVSVLLDEAELEGMAVRATWRRRGVGKELLRAVIATVRVQGAVSLRLEVRANNAPAISLYRSEGFAVLVRRVGYYREPIEDALVLQHAFQP